MKAPHTQVMAEIQRQAGDSAWTLAHIRVYRLHLHIALMVLFLGIHQRLRISVLLEFDVDKLIQSLFFFFNLTAMY